MHHAPLKRSLCLFFFLTVIKRSLHKLRSVIVLQSIQKDSHSFLEKYFCQLLYRRRFSDTSFISAPNSNCIRNPDHPSRPTAAEHLTKIVISPFLHSQAHRLQLLVSVAVIDREEIRPSLPPRKKKNKQKDTVPPSLIQIIHLHITALKLFC